jgi:NAD(P)-dependent dehydrogenase (short-subunit alcohol dehydrogenase family)
VAAQIAQAAFHVATAVRSRLASARHCLVTGARGIGLAVTQALLATGARVTVLGRSAVAADQLRALAGSGEAAAHPQVVAADGRPRRSRAPSRRRASASAASTSWSTTPARRTARRS